MPAYIYVLSLFDVLGLILWHLQDNFGGRLQDRSKEMPKSVKQITRLFPNKVTIQLPEVWPFTPLFLSRAICFVLFHLLLFLKLDRMKLCCWNGRRNSNVIQRS